jgi:hypothetical protein
MEITMKSIISTMTKPAKEQVSETKQPASGNGFPAQRRRTPVQAIHAFCDYCVGDSKPRECESGDCPLHPFRTGRNPNRSHCRPAVAKGHSTGRNGVKDTLVVRTAVQGPPRAETSA